MSYTTLWEEYLRSGRESRRAEGYDPNKEKAGELPSEVEAVSVSVNRFIEWFTQSGLKLRRVISFLDLLGYRMVVVPNDVEVSVTYKDDNSVKRITGAGVPERREAVQIFHRRHLSSDITVSTAEAFDEPIIIRKARGKKPPMPSASPQTQPKSFNESQEDAISKN